MSEETTSHDEAARKLILWDEAIILIKAYNSRQNKLSTTINGGLSSEEDKELSGFSINKSEIQELLNNPETDRIFVAIGYHEGQRHEFTKGHSGIFLGMDVNDNLLISANDKVFNYSLPCPKKCPKNVDLNNL